MTGTCGQCRHFIDDGEKIERMFPGILILSSAFGDTWGDQGICAIHQQLLQPRMTCDRFEPRTEVKDLARPRAPSGP